MLVVAVEPSVADAAAPQGLACRLDRWCTTRRLLVGVGTAVMSCPRLHPRTAPAPPGIGPVLVAGAFALYPMADHASFADVGQASAVLRAALPDGYWLERATPFEVTPPDDCPYVSEAAGDRCVVVVIGFDPHGVYEPGA